MVSLGHIAIFVPDLPAAETYYQRLFDMELLMRETPLKDNLWYTLPVEKGWADAQAAGIELLMVALQRGDFVLALFQGGPAPQKTVLEIGVMMAAAEISSVRQRLLVSGEILDHEHGDLLFNDPFGYRWHLRPEGQTFQSNGRSSGRWLDV